MLKKTLLFMVTILAIASEAAFAALPSDANWRFMGWYGGGAYPMVTADPATAGRLYLISDVTGIWKSDNHGDQWDYRTNGLANLKIVNLAVAPSNPSIVYAGTEIGVHKSTDGGGTWTYLSGSSSQNLTRPDDYRSLVVDPSNPNKLYIGTNNGKVSVSSDGGSSWQALGGVQNPFGNSSAISVLYLTPDGNTLFAGSTSGLRRFSVASNQWTTPSLPTAAVYDIAAAGQTIYVCDGNKVAWTSDLGNSWQSSAALPWGVAYRLSVSNSQGLKILVAWRDGWNGGAVLSTDNGGTWKNLVNNLHYDLASNPTRSWSQGFGWPLCTLIDPFNPSVFYFSDYWGIWRSDDAGANWYEKIKGAPNTIGSDIAVSGKNIYVGTMDDGLNMSTDGGTTFHSAVPGNSYDNSTAGHVWRVNVNGNHIVATNSPWNTAANQVLVSNDGGATFTKTMSGLPAKYPTVNPVWDKGYARALARDPQNPNRYYLGMDGDDGGGFFTSLDGGMSWTRSSGQPGSLKIYNGLAVDPVEPFRIYWAALPSGSSSGGVFRSENYGANWSQVMPGYVFDMAVGPDGTAYAGADSSGPSLYASTNKGTTWTLLKRFDSSGTCDGIAVNPKNPNQIAVSTIKWNGYTPGKVFYSDDKGVTWTDISLNLPYGGGASAMTFSPDGTALYLSRDAGSVYCLTFAADTTPPSIPANVAASVSNGNVSLGWTASTDNIGVTGYKIFRNNAQIGTSATTGYVDSTATTGQVYAYAVAAVDGAGNQSAMSPAVSVTLNDTIAPSAPSALTSTVSGSTVQLAWQTSLDNVAVAGYNVYRNNVKIGTPSTATYTDVSAVVGTPYAYTVKAYDAAGNESAASNSVSVTLLDTASPAVPTGLAAQAAASQVSLTWTANSEADLSQYLVYRNGTRLASVTKPAVTYVDQTVTAGTTYQYAVSAVDATGNESAQCAAVSATVSGGPSGGSVDPTAPVNLSTTVSNGIVKLSWGAPASYAVYGYNIYRNNAYLKSCSTSFQSDSAVTNGATYSYTVKAYDLYGRLSAASNASTVTIGSSTPTTDTAAPSAPSGLAATATSSQVNLSWQASTDNVGVTGYQVFNGTSLVGTSASTNYTFTPVTAGTTYSFTVKALDAAGNVSAASNAASATVPATTPTSDPTAPANLVAFVSNGQVKLSWSAPSKYAVYGYNIYRNNAYQKSCSTTFQSDSAVTNGATYSYTVRAYDLYGRLGGTSNVMAVKI